MSELDAVDLARRLTTRSPAGIADQIGELIEERILPVDTRLPTVRDLAQEVGVSVGTIAQSWSILREQGRVETRRRGGTRVLPRSRRLAHQFEGPGAPLRKLGFLTIGLFDPTNPRPGHESTLNIIAYGEELGFDSAWLRHRHLQHGISSPVAMMAAASQRTSHIELGTAVTPLSWENPLRLAEDLATVDLLSGGRINPGVSLGPPMHVDTAREAPYPEAAGSEGFSHSRAERLAQLMAGEPVREISDTEDLVEEYSNRVEPHSPGLRQRLWYGADSLYSAAWAGAAEMNLLSSSVLLPDEEDGKAPDFAQLQTRQIRAFRAAHPDGDSARASQGLVVIPTDTASREQEEKYRAYAQQRVDRRASPQHVGSHRMIYAPDLVGTSEQLADQLLAHAGYLEVDEVTFALPCGFDEADYRQILHDMATYLGPCLGWSPSTPLD